MTTPATGGDGQGDGDIGSVLADVLSEHLADIMPDVIQEVVDRLGPAGDTASTPGAGSRAQSTESAFRSLLGR